jgi:hypothetical protein
MFVTMFLEAPEFVKHPDKEKTEEDERRIVY